MNTSKTVCTPVHNKRSKPLNVLIVSQFFRPERAVIPTRLAKELVSEGNNVVVVTTFPNRPGGKLYAGYTQRFKHEENMNGVRVRRVPTIINHDRNPLRRVAGLLSFGLSVFSESSWARHADVVYVYATPMTSAIAPRVWRTLFGTPFVLHVQDLWPESVTESGMVGNGLSRTVVRNALAPFLKWLYEGADHVVAIAPKMAAMLASRGLEQKMVSVALNWADELDHDFLRSASTKGALRIVYAGNMGRFQDVETIIEAARKVQDLPLLQIDCYGDGTELEALREQSADVCNLTFHGRVSREAMASVNASSDFQLVTLKNLLVFEGTIPSKFQSSMAAGIPVITTVQGDVRGFVVDSKLGLVANAEDAESLAAAFREAYRMDKREREQLGLNARLFYDTRMSYSVSGNHIHQILTKVADGSRSNRLSKQRDVRRGE